LSDKLRPGQSLAIASVEGISLRSLKLRHHRGAVHTLPFGQIKALTIQTRNWSLMRL
jgi:small-conductance mechanosensitive channel